MENTRQYLESPPRNTPALLRRRVVAAVTALTAAGALVLVSATPAHASVPFTIQSLNGSNNNSSNPTWGQAGTNYSRVGNANYADNRSQPVSGPNSRFISNRIFNDSHQNIFSERRITQWGWTWGQFLDHTFGLRDGNGTTANIPFNSADPMEEFTNTLGYIPFTRSAAAPGTGVTNPRQQVNTQSSYIDAEAVYGTTNSRLEWLRDGSVDGNVTNNAATLMLPGNYLPRKDARGNPATAPAMDVDGRLLANPDDAAVAGDVRANENLALTATQTLFAREHNRIVALLPGSLSAEDRFQIARRIVIAEQQYITYNEFLPAMGVSLPKYTGYKSNVNATISNEFATVGYRAHTQVHGEFVVRTEASRYSPAEIAALQAQGVTVTPAGPQTILEIPLNVAFFNPDLVEQVELGPALQGLGFIPQYNNDEQIDNQLRSVLFQVPVSGNPQCLDGPGLPACFDGVIDLGAIDVERGRDHGMPTYNQMRQAYGLPTKSSFTAITGESTESFPSDPELTPGNEVNDPDSLDFLSLRNIDGVNIPLNDPTAQRAATDGTRRTTVAARMKAVFGNVNSVDAFTGMLAEPHVANTEMGELQLAIWTKQFTALRDGDKFFYGNNQGLSWIKNTYGIDYRRTLAEIIASNTDIPLTSLEPNVFLVADEELPAATCRVNYYVEDSWNGGFHAHIGITNLGTTAINGWTLRFRFANGQTFTYEWDAWFNVSNSQVTGDDDTWNQTIPAGGTIPEVAFDATWDNYTNSEPPWITLNNKRCNVT
ncbi:hypothetical protein GCM10009682_50840 [Luedemannella flava]|uniref:CBM2 domain-containing protein n=1 Tax=Luedemannella flava TaxID=349316 RepID=A0ABN2MF12_9ACTN